MCARNDFHILLFRILHVCLFMTLVGFPSTNIGAELLNAMVVTNYGTQMLQDKASLGCPIYHWQVLRRKTITPNRLALTRGEQKCRLLRAESGSVWHCSNGGDGVYVLRSTCHDDDDKFRWRDRCESETTRGESREDWARRVVRRSTNNFNCKYARRQSCPTIDRIF